MRKFLCVLLIVLLISGCSNEYDGWKKVDVPFVGSLKIPQEWVYNESDNIIYFTDKKMSDSTEYVIYLIGIICNQGELQYIYQHIDENMRYEKLISSETLSNSAIIGENEYLINDKTHQKFFLDLYSSNKQLYIIGLDDSVDYELVKKIGNSYKMNVGE